MARGGRRGERRRGAARACATHGSLALLRRTSVSAISGMKMRVGRSGIAQGSQSRKEATLAARPDAKGPRFQHTRGRQAQQNVSKRTCVVALLTLQRNQVCCADWLPEKSLEARSRRLGFSQLAFPWLFLQNGCRNLCSAHIPAQQRVAAAVHLLRKSIIPDLHVSLAYRRGPRERHCAIFFTPSRE